MFDGEQIHAHSYTSGDQLEGKDVVIVGAGNSAMGIAVEGSYRANSVNVSIRRGQWILRKMLGPIAADTIALPGWLPWWATAARLRIAAILSGPLKKYGLPTPPHAPGQSHPVQSDTFKQRIGAGAITVRPAISHLAGDRVEFVDGTHAKADLIVWATGYNVSFPFFPRGLLDVHDNDLPLWKSTIHPGHPGLFFLGLLQPVGAVMPLAEAQAKWIAEILRREYTFPPLARIEREMMDDDARNKRQFYNSPRHTMEVDFDNYLWDLGRERGGRADEPHRWKVRGDHRGGGWDRSGHRRGARPGWGEGGHRRSGRRCRHRHRRPDPRCGWQRRRRHRPRLHGEISGHCRSRQRAGRPPHPLRGDHVGRPLRDRTRTDRRGADRGQPPRRPSSAPPGEATYAPTKHGVYGYLKAVREELRGSGIEISAVMPGVVDTDLAVGTATGAAALLTPMDVARSVVRTIVRPRFEVTLPGFIWRLSRIVDLLPAPVRDLMHRLMVPNQVEKADLSTREGYESRFSH